MKFKAEKKKSCGMPLVLLVPYFGPNPKQAGIFECEALTKNASVSIAESQMFGSKAPIGTFPSLYLGILWAVCPLLPCALTQKQPSPANSDRFTPLPAFSYQG